MTSKKPSLVRNGRPRIRVVNVKIHLKNPLSSLFSLSRFTAIFSLISENLAICLINNWKYGTFCSQRALSWFCLRAKRAVPRNTTGGSLGCANVPNVWNLIVSQAIPIPYDPNNMRQLQKLKSEVVLYCPQPMFVYIVKPLVRKNRLWHFSKIWLPKVSKWVLK